MWVVVSLIMPKRGSVFQNPFIFLYTLLKNKNMNFHIKLTFGTPSYETDGTTTKCHLPVFPNDTLNVMPFVSEGIATLKPNDSFNELTGKKVSLAKAESHAYRVIASMLKPEIERLQSMVESANKFIEKANRVTTHNLEYINKF